MRIVQVIDSLEVGGAERMAVNYANALAKRIAFSGLVVTRKEGSLGAKCDAAVPYLFLERKRTVDIGAILRLRKFCKTHGVEYLHAHSTSCYTAVLVKMLLPKIKIIWHDHYGKSEFLHARKSLALKWASYFFHGVIAVNDQLKLWSERELHCAGVTYLPNFAVIDTDMAETRLEGKDGKRIVCVANLRDQKDHFMLLDAAKLLVQKFPDWTFHLVGKDFGDAYATRLRREIAQSLAGNVFVYGTRNDTVHILSQSSIAILTSKSEGLPVAVLEYGTSKKPVVVTQVGELPLVVENNRNGLTVPSGDAKAFAEALTRLIADPGLRKTLGESLYQTVLERHSEAAVVTRYLAWLKNLAS
jgi:glycosyltransferase involved in cell wall biosynthesis